VNRDIELPYVGIAVPDPAPLDAFFGEGSANDKAGGNT
jgi:hypothetical protein